MMKEAFSFAFCAMLPYQAAAFWQSDSGARKNRRAKSCRHYFRSSGKRFKTLHSATDSVRIDKSKKEILLYGDAPVTAGGCEVRANVIKIKQEDYRRSNPRARRPFLLK